jgi:hypothetical protein
MTKHTAILLPFNPVIVEVDAPTPELAAITAASRAKMAGAWMVIAGGPVTFEPVTFEIEERRTFAVIEPPF